MEKKTMGSFLAALRKANGMTQKELAERLNVSDKAVSRWERDECAPDLSLIPVIGEIFGVTADELIRGERRKPEEECGNSRSVKLEKELGRILSAGKTRFQNHSMIVIGLGMIGLIVAMLCNFCFNRAYVGFFMACVFYVVAGICMCIFARMGFAGVEGEELETEQVRDYRRFLLRTTGRCLTVLVMLFVFCLPLVLLPWDAYLGILMGNWLAAGVLYCALAAVICLPVSWVIKLLCVKKGTYPLPEEELGLYLTRTRRKLKYYLISAGLICLLVVFFCVEYVGIQIGNGSVQNKLLWYPPMLEYEPVEFWMLYGSILVIIAAAFFLYWRKRKK